MAQYGRPVADITVGAWTTSPLWDKLDEVSSDDATSEITTGNNPSNVTGEVRLGSVTDPNLGTGHVLRIRAYTTNNCTLAWALYQGTTLIANCGTITLGGSYATTTYTLTEAEAAAITNYSDLRIRFTGNGQGRARVTWIEAQFPDQLIQKSGAATISSTTHVLSGIKKGAVIAVAFGILGHVAATGIETFNAFIHGNGTTTVSARKNANEKMSLTFEDNFNRLDEELEDSPYWRGWGNGIRGVTGHRLTNQRIEANPAAVETDFVDSAVLPIGPDQYCEATLVSRKNGMLLCRFDPTNRFNQIGYSLNITDAGQTRFFTYIGGSGGGAIGSWTPADTVKEGDRVRFEIEGTTLRLIINGNLTLTEYNSNTAAGSPGLWSYMSSVIWDDYKAGELRPTYAPLPPMSGNGTVSVAKRKGATVAVSISDSGNIYIWSEDHYGAGTISGGGALAALGSKSARSNKKAYDDFERPDGPLGTDWQPVAGMSPPNILNGGATADSGGLQGALWAQYGGWPADQSVSVRVKEAGALQVGAFLRSTPGNGRGYLVSVLQTNPGRYWVFTNTGVGSWAWSWTSGFCSAIAAGDVLTFQVTGYPPLITIYKNGVWQAEHFPTPINQIASGIPGVAVNQWAAVDEWWGVLGAPSYASVYGGGTLSAAGWKNGTPVYCRAKFMDNFNRSNRDLDGDNGWYVPAGRVYGPQILSNQVKHKYISGFSDPEAVFQSFLQKASVSERMQIAVKSYGDDYWREIQILAISPSTGKGFSVDLKPRTYLYFLAFDDYANNAFRNVGGYAGNANVLSGDRVEFIVYDDQWRVYQNGHLIGSGTDSALAQPDLRVGIQTMDPALSLSVDDLSAYCYTPGANNAVSARGNLSLYVAKSLQVPIVIHGGGSIFASIREEARRSVAISGGGSVTLAGRVGARRTSSISGGGSVALSAKPGWLAEPHVTGNGVWIATGDATFIDTASVFALIHGGGTVIATGDKANEGDAWTFGGGQVSVHYDRSWESVPIQKIDSPDSVCYLIKMEMDYCSRTFGISPCLATGTRCYNTWKTCKYIAAYLATKKTYRYVSANFPQAFPDARPYIADVKYMPTEIKTNLTVNARVSFSMLDEPDADVDTDPYWSTRSSHPGTYWKRWLARNTNYKDRIVRIYEGVYGKPESTYVQKWTGRLENIKIKGDKFTFEAVDLLKDLAKIEVPPKTNAKLALALAANAGQTFTITEDADKFPSSGYVRIDDEIIQYTALNVATKTFTIGGIGNRAQFGTVAAAHAQNGKVQQAKFYAEKNPLEILLDMLLGDAGMVDSWVETANVNNVNAAFTTTSAYVELGVAVSQSWPSVGIMKLENWSTPGVIEYVRYASKTYVPGGVGVSPAWRFNFETYSGVMTGRALFGTPRITGGVNSIRAEIGYFEYVDTDAFYQYRDWPAHDIDFTSIISEPTKLSDLYMEIVDLLDAKSWVAENLKITIRKNTTNTPTTGYVSLSDADNIIEDSGSVDVNEKSRISRMTVYWDKVATGKASDEMSYRRLDIAIDPDAETNYGDPVEKVVKSRWIDPYVTLEETVQQFVKNLAIRRIQRCKHAQNLITVKVPEKDAGVNTGDYVRLSTDELLESDGLPISARMYQVVKRERSDKAVTLTFIQVTPRRMAVIAPAGLPSYPSATEVQRAYGYICDATGKMSDGTDGYFIW